METARGLAKRITPKPQPALSRHQGVITAVTAPTVSLTLDGGNTVLTDIRRMESYSPTVGDTVEVLRDGSDIFVLGKLA